MGPIDFAIEPKNLFNQAAEFDLYNEIEMNNGVV